MMNLVGTAHASFVGLQEAMPCMVGINGKTALKYRTQLLDIRSSGIRTFVLPVETETITPEIAPPNWSVEKMNVAENTTKAYITTMSNLTTTALKDIMTTLDQAHKGKMALCQPLEASAHKSIQQDFTILTNLKVKPLNLTFLEPQWNLQRVTQRETQEPAGAKVNGRQ